MRAETEYEVEDSPEDLGVLWMDYPNPKELVVTIRDACEMELAGGKAFNISRLAREGFAVPDGFCITTEGYQLFCERNKLQNRITEILASVSYDDTKSIEENANKIKKIFSEAEIPEEIKEEISNIHYDNVVVRSSADFEDLPDASFAGQQETYMNPVDLEDAVKKCWASLWTERALSYRHSKGIKEMPKMAVIIQEAVPCDISGVVFTKNPVTSTDEIIIEAVFGLGELLVSGEVNPDHYVLDSHLCLKKKEEGKKSYKIVLAEHGTKKVKTEQGACLSREMLKKIGETALRIETLFHSPQDIEFGIYKNKLYILQSRNITTGREDVWTRGPSDDYWTGVTSPLFFSLLGEFMNVYVNQEGNEIMGFTELRDVPLLRYHKAHVYFNTRVLREMLKYNPKFSRAKELLGYFPEYERKEIRELPFSMWKQVLAQMRIALFDWDGMLFNTYKEYEKFSQEYVNKLKEFDKIDLKSLPDSELLDKYQYLYHICLKHYRLVRWGINNHNAGMNMILKQLILEWYDKDFDRTYNILVSGLPQSKTMETNGALSNLVRVRNTPLFGREFETFLKEYGHRSYSRDIVFPTWAEAPDLVLDIVDSLSDSYKDIQKIETQKRREREELTKKVLEHIGNQKSGIVKKKIFKIILFYAQKYIEFRENQRFFLDHQNARFRKIFLEIGRRLEERNILRKEDVFFLFKEEVFDALENEKVNKKLLDKRKREFIEYKEKLPPKFLQGVTEFDEQECHGKEITGIASSPGVVKGTIRIVKTIQEIHTVKEGEIMVTVSIDPGWTPVFVKIKGLITETGGVLSHGAVISREYGIPAVTGVSNVAEILKEKDTVILDGNSGKIYMG